MFREAMVFALLVLATASPVAAQLPGTNDPPPRRGGFTPFRDRGFAGTVTEAVSLLQDDCPLHVAITRVDRDGRGIVTLVARLSNLSDRPVAGHTLLAWSVAKDGTIRGRRELPGNKEIAAGKERQVELALRAVPVQVGDVVVVAVRETRGVAAWRRDASDLEREVKAAIAGR